MFLSYTWDAVLKDTKKRIGTAPRPKTFYEILRKPVQVEYRDLSVPGRHFLEGTK